MKWSYGKRMIISTYLLQLGALVAFSILNVSEIKWFAAPIVFFVFGSLNLLLFSHRTYKGTIFVFLIAFILICIASLQESHTRSMHCKFIYRSMVSCLISGIGILSTLSLYMLELDDVSYFL